MSRSEAAIFTNMCMISDGNGNVLVQDRRDPDWPGITFPGGHVEPGRHLPIPSSGRSSRRRA